MTVAPGLLAPDGLDASQAVAATTAATHPNIRLRARLCLTLFLPHPAPTRARSRNVAAARGLDVRARPARAPTRDWRPAALGERNLMPDLAPVPVSEFRAGMFRWPVSSSAGSMAFATVRRSRGVLSGGRSASRAPAEHVPGTGRRQWPSRERYLDERWSPPWQHAHLEWPDFGVPDIDALWAAPLDLLERSRRGESVEVGCLGGHGRTGTALECLAVVGGVRRPTPWPGVRANYCRKAVETREQEALAASLSR